MTILLVTVEDDLHTDLVEDHLKKAGVSHFRLNTDALSRDFKITYGIKGQKPFVFLGSKDGGGVSADDVGAVWYRRVRVNPSTGQTRGQPLFDYSFDEHVGFFKNLWVALGHARWMDNPARVHHLQDHRLEQYEQAIRVGLEVPDTYFTNDGRVPVGALEERGQIAVKAIAQPFVMADDPNGVSGDVPVRRVFTRLIRRGEFSDEQLNVSSRNTPIQFQDYEEKDVEIRLTVVGEKLFPCEIDSQASERTMHDWRRYDFQKVSHRSCELPEGIKTKILQFMGRVELVFGAIDLIRTPDGRYVFLEVNPAGQWQWVEALTAMPISKAIADWLIEHDG
ncbi:hypothetical protein A3A38_04640 [Candidatus Kaiserbacteria bacterium RIFCSPLOWO2_01_FULL_53_17]|uniref:MvdD-like pre-ATP grasp domain-containing protein n=1 Tax=Candidatus Kaiserbacteria bacterium RIFCSPLOWO2_01_FULL_53_17 TaxID=1798511 RepID=A0A1F6EG15_9BACT|nr:MAG: hypothetical protein A3A38_04640 [Candidatus Kaiserbacteria bacterium RIFCSPLOWO2_01_FULL_53_17]